MFKTLTILVLLVGLVVTSSYVYIFRERNHTLKQRYYASHAQVLYLQQVVRENCVGFRAVRAAAASVEASAIPRDLDDIVVPPSLEDTNITAAVQVFTEPSDPTAERPGMQFLFDARGCYVGG